ncbi:MAG: DUF1569 domain-containing protein [Gemmatimonadota bacterium]
MTNLLDASTRSATFARLDALDPDSDRRWGRMNVGGMLCHLTDSFLACMGERETGDRTSIVSKTVMRFIAVSTPLPWPKGLPTLPEGDQEKQGTPPGLFEADRARLREVTERFLDELDGARYFHPLFGRMRRGEWGRWAWRHMDHHFRQFGV